MPQVLSMVQIKRLTPAPAVIFMVSACLDIVTVTEFCNYKYKFVYVNVYHLFALKFVKIIIHMREREGEGEI